MADCDDIALECEQSVGFPYLKPEGRHLCTSPYHDAPLLRTMMLLSLFNPFLLSTLYNPFFLFLLCFRPSPKRSENQIQ
ncbi:hypothetical protein GDO86_018854 [Hymenochirus boettgeri]|uniref:Uncharacterized protein n=1 Tax=Hymenochirus boettgeri TaxID=247094 RepID=A0A8T2IKS2_9PIPI|nr:hypothetical protein GDO86_018854 [Hymenochirus boettgeri]